MDDYYESDEIDALLRSTLRGDQTNVTDTVTGVQTPSAAESEEAAARRRRIRFEDDLRPLSEEEQSDEARAAMLNSAIPEK